MSQAKVFIGSTGEARSTAVALQALLDRVASIRVWSQGVFEQNRSNLDNLIEAVAGFDFACIICTPDDYTVSREKGSAAPRDNVLFEFGLFLGVLGRERVFFLYPRGIELKLPSDLLGITFFDYKPPTDDDPLESVLAPVADKISRYISERGVREKRMARRYGPILAHNAIDRVASLADAALYFSQPRFGFKKEVKELLLRSEVIPTRFFYQTDEGAEFWIRMSASAKYRFHSNSMKLFRQVTSRFANCISEDSQRCDVDFVSLGSGDGVKDQIVLGALLEAGFSSLAYYPIDISEKLLVECVRTVSAGNYDHRGLQTKAIIGDFLNLDILRSVYEDRSSPNLFSILGNTMGNTDEARVVEALRQSMYSGDYALIEINCERDELKSRSPFVASRLVLDYTCMPLRVAGIRVQGKKISLRTSDALSVFNCATSIETSYQGLVIDGHAVDVAPLSYDHRYDLEDFKHELTTLLGVQILDFQREGNAAAVLMKKL